MPFTPNGILTFCTDFGTADGYTAAMKGRALSIDPNLRIEDITHDIPSWDIRRAAFALWTALPLFPAGTVHVVVVDPGVGTERAAIIAITNNQAVVAPDNGVISLLIKRDPNTQTFRIPPTKTDSETFHGRDLFAPCGAQIATGSLHVPGELSPLERPIVFPHNYETTGNTVQGSVLCEDKFGNLITSIPWTAIADPASATVFVDKKPIEQMARTFGDHPPGTLVFLRGSSGLLEVSCVQGSAKNQCNASSGSTVHISRTH